MSGKEDRITTMLSFHELRGCESLRTFTSRQIADEAHAPRPPKTGSVAGSDVASRWSVAKSDTTRLSTMATGGYRSKLLHG